MSTTFTDAEQSFLTSESVTEGHPDKICDQISDAVLDGLLAQDPCARVACETATTTGLVLIMGEITTAGYLDMAKVARQTIREIGYSSSEMGFDADSCGVLVSIKEQSTDIAMGVDCSMENKAGGEADELSTGAGDQGMMIGFACNETPELMPTSIALAHRLCRRLAEVRRDGTLPYLRPDGKSQVTVEYHRGKPVRVGTVVVSSQHAPEVGHDQIEADIEEHVIRAVIGEELLCDTCYFVNPTGRFVIGGPAGDAGLTGRKIIADTSGGGARHGGGAFSGKDPTKVDRSAAYMARYIAKNVVAAGIADRFELQVSYAIGVAQPTSLDLETFGTGNISDERIKAIIRDVFDMRPAAIIRDLDLRRPIYRATAAYGHFGRTDLDLPWERTDKAETLRKLAGA